MEVEGSESTTKNATECETFYSNCVKFENFVKCKGQGYSQRLVPLFDTSTVADTYGRQQIVSRLPVQFTESTQRLVQCIKDTLQELSTQGLSVTKFKIGKTFADRRRMQNHVFKTFDPMAMDTWDVDIDTLSGCKDKYQGLVVIGCITRELVPPLQPTVTQEEYVDALEKQLVIHFKYTENDIRLENKYLESERRTDRQQFGGVIYIAIQCG